MPAWTSALLNKNITRNITAKSVIEAVGFVGLNGAILKKVIDSNNKQNMELDRFKKGKSVLATQTFLQPKMVEQKSREDDKNQKNSLRYTSSQESSSQEETSCIDNFFKTTNFGI